MCVHTVSPHVSAVSTSWALCPHVNLFPLSLCPAMSCALCVIPSCVPMPLVPVAPYPP